MFQKTLAEAEHFAAGVLDLPVGGEKPVKPSKQNTMFFVVFEGSIEVKIHDVAFRLKRGSQFVIPRANYYSITNIGKTVARLFFSQSTDTLANEIANQAAQRARQDALADGDGDQSVAVAD